MAEGVCMAYVWAYAQEKVFKSTGTGVVCHVAQTTQTVFVRTNGKHTGNVCQPQ